MSCSPLVLDWAHAQLTFAVVPLIFMGHPSSVVVPLCRATFLVATELLVADVGEDVETWPKRRHQSP